MTRALPDVLDLVDAVLIRGNDGFMDIKPGTLDAAPGEMITFISAWGGKRIFVNKAEVIAVGVPEDVDEEADT